MDLTIAGPMTPIINKVNPLGTSPNLTVPTNCINWKFNNDYSGPTGIYTYENRFQLRSDYLVNQWNYVALH